MYVKHFLSLIMFKRNVRVVRIHFHAVFNAVNLHLYLGAKAKTPTLSFKSIFSLNIVFRQNISLSFTEPGKVQNLTTSNFTTTSITLTWQQPVGNVSHYVVQMVGSSSSNTTTQTTYMFESLTPGNNYTFLVYSVVSNKSGQQETISSYTSKCSSLDGLIFSCYGLHSAPKPNWTDNRK